MLPGSQLRDVVHGNALINASTCARVTGFSRKWVEAVKAQPGGPFSGRFTTRVAFETWVMKNPAFRATHYWVARKEQRRLEKDLQDRVADRSGARFRKRSKNKGNVLENKTRVKIS